MYPSALTATMGISSWDFLGGSLLVVEALASTILDQITTGCFSKSWTPQNAWFLTKKDYY